MGTEVTMSICRYCKQPMNPGGGCTAVGYSDSLDGSNMVEVIKNTEQICHDCNAGPGKAHHPGCDWERCRRCGGQAIGCDCNLPHVITETLV